jgi:hypothetical protein
MRTNLTSASAVEAAVTAAVAVLMTFAGFEMLQGVVEATQRELATPARPAAVASSTAARMIAMPHVEESVA